MEGGGCMRTQYLTHDILIVKLSLNFVCLCLTLSHVDNIAIGDFDLC